MWSALMNGGGGAGGGYVPSQGWEFVPCPRVDRGRGKTRIPSSRRISSPPTVFSHIYDSQFGAATGGGEGGAGTQLEILRGQMWPSPEPQQQQHTQHTRLKKKLEDLKKRHVQDKEDWIREKESLLREVADIQGGENRRILLDLKRVLEEVQVEVKKEEEKRSELQLQYTRDRCAWELEKAELKCRIAQLEAREGSGLISGALRSAVSPGSVASQSARERHDETSTLRREREEQRRLLADTHYTAMDLRSRLEHNERDWLREKAELLERFDLERREWESQLKDMQRKIEELYCVRTKRRDTGRQDDNDIFHRLSIRSTSTASSLLSDNEMLSSSSQSEPTRSLPLPAHNRNLSVGRHGLHTAGFQEDSFHGLDVGGQIPQNDQSQPVVNDFRSRGIWQQESAADGREAVDTIDLDAGFHGAPQKNASNSDEDLSHVHPEESLLWAELTYCSNKKKNTTALNAALKEIARVSEELCSYQEEIRKKSGDKRDRSESLCLPEESGRMFDHKLEVDEAPCDLGQIYDDLRALQRENWITLSGNESWRADGGPSKSWRSNSADSDRSAETKMSPGLLCEMDTAGPPIPPRTSSWNLSSPTHPDTELHIPESPMATMRKCHSPCALVDRKCSSPSIVRKFEAMLQENEGKVLIDGVVASCAVPANSECNKGCCHNRWSCDASKFTGSKLSAYGTVQKSFSEVNILNAGKDSDHCPGVGNFKSPELQMPQIVKELPLDLTLTSLEIAAAGPSHQGSRRNITLEQKTAEFNRTLFQAEMGRGVEEPGAVTDARSVGFQPVFSPTCASDEILSPMETLFSPLSTDVTTSVMDVRPEVSLSLSTSNSMFQSPVVQARQMKCGLEVKEVTTKQGIPSDLSPEQPHTGLREATTITSLNPAHHSEVKHKVQTASSPSRKTQCRADTEDPFSEPANTQPGQSSDGSSSTNENPHGAKPQSARAGVSLQQLSAENKQRQMTQPGHQAQLRHASAPPSQLDSSRPGPRMMNDHPWKTLTLAAYPRPEGSRSNYGAVERILKNYESAARAQQNQSQPNKMASSPNVSVRQEEDVTELVMVATDPLPPALRHTKTSHTSQLHTTHAQLGSQCVTGVKEVHLTVQEKEETSVSSSSVQTNFSRPARPANRRLPSRWANRSPTSSSSTSSSPSTTPIVPPFFLPQKHSSSFTYSHTFHIETGII